jgi:hypothetical protein
MGNPDRRHIKESMRPVLIGFCDPTNQRRDVIHKVDDPPLADRESLEHFAPETDVKLLLPKRVRAQGAVVTDEAGQR